MPGGEWYQEAMQGNPGQMVPGLQPDEPNSKGFEVLNTGQIYSKIAASGPFKKSAVRHICQQFMDMSFEQARQNGAFEMGSMMKIRVQEVPAVAATQKRRAKPAKKNVDDHTDGDVEKEDSRSTLPH